MLTEFAKNKFRTFFEVSLWLNLIGWATWGAVTGYGLDRYGSLGYGFIGLILGAIIGLLSTVLFGGLVAVFLNIDENLEIIKDNSFEAETSEAKTSNVQISNVQIPSNDPRDPLGLLK